MLTHWTAPLPQKVDFGDKEKDGKNGKKVEAMEKGGSNGKKRRKLTSRDAFGCARHLKNKKNLQKYSQGRQFSR